VKSTDYGAHFLCNICKTVKHSQPRDRTQKLEHHPLSAGRDCLFSVQFLQQPWLSGNPLLRPQPEERHGAATHPCAAVVCLRQSGCPTQLWFNESANDTQIYRIIAHCWIGHLQNHVSPHKRLLKQRNVCQQHYLFYTLFIFHHEQLASRVLIC
jgi:hypothetical protein